MGVAGEPYVLSLCERHLAQLQRDFPPGSVWVIYRYGEENSAGPA